MPGDAGNLFLSLTLRSSERGPTLSAGRKILVAAESLRDCVTCDVSCTLSPASIVW